MGRKDEPDVMRELAQIRQDPSTIIQTIDPDSFPSIGDILLAMRKIVAANLVPDIDRVIRELELKGFKNMEWRTNKSVINRIISQEKLLEKCWEGRITEQNAEAIAETAKQIKWDKVLAPQYGAFDLAGRMKTIIEEALIGGKVQLDNLDDIKAAAEVMNNMNRTAAEAFERVAKVMSLYGPALAPEHAGELAGTASRMPVFDASIFGKLEPGDTVQAVQITKG